MILLWALNMPQAIRFTIFQMTDVTEEGFSLHITFWASLQMLRAQNESVNTEAAAYHVCSAVLLL